LLNTEITDKQSTCYWGLVGQELSHYSYLNAACKLSTP